MPDTQDPQQTNDTYPTGNHPAGAHQAANIARSKIDSLYGREPAASAELSEARAEKHHSKHQQYLLHLSGSGLSLAEIQTAWHDYYNKLDDDQKHEVWEEFYSQQAHQSAQYDAQGNTNHAYGAQPTRRVETQHQPVALQTNQRAKILTSPKPHETKHYDERPTLTEGARQRLERAKHKKPSHAKSLLFGLTMGALFVGVMMFGFFNEKLITPFITPAKSTALGKIIVDPNDTKADPNESSVYIPKINQYAPVIYGAANQEATIQNNLESGVVHYGGTQLPGEQGIVALFGHSSNNILNPGKYKFVFLQLSKVTEGDLFQLTKGGVRYTYKVYNTEVVEPTQVSVLYTAPRPNTAVLVTCDPPGTSLKRLVVRGEQISPAPAGNKAPTATPNTEKVTEIPSNSPSLWDRLFGN
jgi:LPXTG-site transpeptidase (sortase) family protein